MVLRLSSLFIGLILSSLVSLRQGNALEQRNGFLNSSGTIPDGITDGQEKDIEYSDFEDDDGDDEDSDKFLNLVGLDDENINSVMHLHRKQGEILVPCFGMWWPVGGGGGGVSYDYVGDYYGDYRKKRRRSRKQKKAAKMKKKKS